jgi:hypothetical protein
MKDDAKQLGASFLSLLLPNPSNVNKVANSINDDVLLPPEKFVRNGLREARCLETALRCATNEIRRWFL